MSFQAVLQYDLSSGYQPNVNTRLRVAAIDLNEALTARALGFTVTNDLTISTGATTIRRTLTLLTTPIGDTMYRTEDDVKKVTTKLFKNALALLVPSVVTASEPVVTTV